MIVLRTSVSLLSIAEQTMGSYVRPVNSLVVFIIVSGIMLHSFPLHCFYTHLHRCKGLP